MNKTIDFSQTGGLYIYQETLAYMQNAYGAVADAIAKLIGTKVVLSGMVEQGASVTEGWAVVNGEVLLFEGGVKSTYMTVETVITDEQFDDGSMRPTYTLRRLKFATLSDSKSFLYTDLARLPYGETLGSFSVNVQKLFKSVFNFENEVIVEGCTVNYITPAKISISAGTCLFAGKLVEVGAYEGAFPILLNSVGAYVNEVVSGDMYIRFDPYTSQRYADVLKRALTAKDEIKMFSILSDRFDAAGKGRWEMKGFELLSNMQGRVPLGYWFDGVSVSNVTDYMYLFPGTSGGERMHTLSVNEMPSHNHKFYEAGDRKLDDTDSWRVATSYTDRYGLVDAKMANTGGDQAHNNVQPYTVVVYAKRV